MFWSHTHPETGNCFRLFIAVMRVDVPAYSKWPNLIPQMEVTFSPLKRSRINHPKRSLGRTWLIRLQSSEGWFGISKFLEDGHAEKEFGASKNGVLCFFCSLDIQSESPQVGLVFCSHIFVGSVKSHTEPTSPKIWKARWQSMGRFSPFNEWVLFGNTKK